MIPQLGSIWVDPKGRRLQVEKIDRREKSPAVVHLRILNPVKSRYTRMGDHNFDKKLRLEKAAHDLLVTIDPKVDIQAVLMRCRHSGFRGFAMPNLGLLVGTAMDTRAISLLPGVTGVMTGEEYTAWKATQESLEPCA